MKEVANAQENCLLKGLSTQVAMISTISTRLQKVTCSLANFAQHDFSSSVLVLALIVLKYILVCFIVMIQTAVTYPPYLLAIQRLKHFRTEERVLLKFFYTLCPDVFAKLWLSYNTSMSAYRLMLHDSMRQQ